jgi:hypothetical protein
MKKLSAKDRDALLETLQRRFEKNMHRHKGITWEAVATRLAAKAEKCAALHLMEQTGGEPDVVGHDGKTGEIIFFDCSVESPSGRRSLCFDQAALDARKEHKPQDAAVEMAEEMGVELLTEAQYRELQKTGDFDSKTSSWVQTPADIRKLGGALACDRRYGHVFVYPNGAQSYYAARGFRASLRV